MLQDRSDSALTCITDFEPYEESALSCVAELEPDEKQWYDSRLT